MRALTGNLLAEGEAVFWTGQDWSPSFGAARLYGDPAEAEAAEAHAKSQRTMVVDPYLIDVVEVEGGYAPVSYRERLRALGPTNKPDHGKQALGGADVAVLARAQGAARSKGRVDLIRRK